MKGGGQGKGRWVRGSRWKGDGESRKGNTASERELPFGPVISFQLT